MKKRKSDPDLSFSVVWSPLPPITWLCPIIGHLGITDSAGVASDFQGPYSVGEDGNMLFGAPTRALKLRISPSTTLRNDDHSQNEADGDGIVMSGLIISSPAGGGGASGGKNHKRRNWQDDGDRQWDDAVLAANEEYRHRMHNICCDNCHSHVAYALNRMPVGTINAPAGRSVHSWDMVKLAVLVFIRGEFLSWSGLLLQFLPFTIICFLVFVFSRK